MTQEGRLLAAGAVAALVWAWFASGVRTFTRPAEVLTFIPGLIVLLLTVRPGARPRAMLVADRPKPLSWLPWLALLGAGLALELTELFAQPRSDHPTLSSLTNTVLETHPVRFVGYLGWLAAGWLLVRDLAHGRKGGHE